MSDMILQVNHLSKSFGTHEVLRDIDFTVNRGDVTSIIGASGSGKSTLLRCINLLENPTSGEILYHGENVVRRGFNAAAYRSRVGMVFQSFNLFNNMTVLENCIVGQVKVLKQPCAHEYRAGTVCPSRTELRPVAGSSRAGTATGQPATAQRQPGTLAAGRTGATRHVSGTLNPARVS